MAPAPVASGTHRVKIMTPPSFGRGYFFSRVDAWLFKRALPTEHTSDLAFARKYLHTCVSCSVHFKGKPRKDNRCVILGTRSKLEKGRAM